MIICYVQPKQRKIVINDNEKKKQGLHGEESEEGVMNVVVKQRTMKSRNIQKRLNLALEFTDVGNDDDGNDDGCNDDDDGLSKPMITKLSENPT